MSVQAWTWVIEHSQHQATAYTLLLMIANHTDREGQGCFASLKTLAKEARISEHSVPRLLRKLEASGELIIERGTGRGNSNTYRLPGVKTDILSPFIAEKSVTLSPFNSVKSDKRVTLPTIKSDKRLTLSAIKTDSLTPKMGTSVLTVNSININGNENSFFSNKEDEDENAPGLRPQHPCDYPLCQSLTYATYCMEHGTLQSQMQELKPKYQGVDAAQEQRL